MSYVIHSNKQAPSDTGANNAIFNSFTTANGSCNYLHNSAVGEPGWNGIVNGNCNVTTSQCSLAVAVDCGDTKYGKSIILQMNNAWQLTVSPISLSGSSLAKTYNPDNNVDAAAPTVSAAAAAAPAWKLWRACPGNNEYLADVDRWMMQLPPQNFTVHANGSITFVTERGCSYALTTATTGGWNVPSNATIPLSTPMKLPYSDNFSSYYDGQQPKYWAAESGVFEARTSQDGVKVMQQMVTKRPIEWVRLKIKPKKSNQIK